MPIVFFKNKSGGSGGVASFNTRTGAVTLLDTDIISALGYTPGQAGNGLTQAGSLLNVGGALTNAIFFFANGNELKWVDATVSAGSLDLGPGRATFGWNDQPTAKQRGFQLTGALFEVFDDLGLKGMSYRGNYAAANVGNPRWIMDQAAVLAAIAAGTAGVASFNTRTGAVTLLSADVVAALGYTPVNPGVAVVLSSDLTVNGNFKMLAGAGISLSGIYVIDSDTDSIYFRAITTGGGVKFQSVGGTVYGGMTDNGVWSWDNGRMGSTQTTQAGSTSGTAIFSQPQRSLNYKKVMIRCAALVGTASYTFPTAFSIIPAIMSSNSLAAAKITSLSTTAVTVTGATDTGWLVLEGY